MFDLESRRLNKCKGTYEKRELGRTPSITLNLVYKRAPWGIYRLPPSQWMVEII